MTAAACTRLIIVLATLSSGLAWLVERQLSDLSEATAGSPPAERAMQAVADTAAALPTANPLSSEAYERLLEENPFAMPLAPESEVATPVNERPLTIKPVAIATAPEQRLVLLQVEGEPRLVRAKVGDDVAGWTVLEITANVITLEGPDGDLDALPLKPPRENVRLERKALADQPLDGVIDTLPPVEEDDDDLLVWTPESLKSLISSDIDR